MLPKGRLRLSVRRTRTRKISTTRCFQKHRIFCRVGWKEEHNYKCYQVLPKGRIFLSDRKTNRRKLQVQSVALKGQASPVGSNGKKRKITNTTRWIRWINVGENWRDNQEWTTRNTSNSRHTRHKVKTNITQKLKGWATRVRTPPKIGGEPMCSQRDRKAVPASGAVVVVIVW